MPLTWLLLLATQTKATVKLYPGAPAPPLKIFRWIKGNELKALPPQGVQVIEFWATWCEPCIEAMPHLTALAHKYKQVTIIAASIDNKDTPNLDRFVKSQGEKMDFQVGFTGITGGMSDTYLDAANQNGIPVAFVVKNRTLQWIGDPSELEEKIPQILAGTNDIKADKKAFLDQVKAEPATQQDTGKLADADQLFMAGGHKDAHKAIDQLPDSPEKQHVLLKWKAVEDPQAFLSGANNLLKNDPEDVGRLALEVMDYPGTYKSAIKAVEDALKATKRQSGYLLYCAVVVCDTSKDKKAAKAYAREALKLLSKQKAPASDSVIEYYKSLLK